MASLAASDLVIIDGGGNDAADLVRVHPEAGSTRPPATPACWPRCCSRRRSARRWGQCCHHGRHWPGLRRPWPEVLRPDQDLGARQGCHACGAAQYARHHQHAALSDGAGQHQGRHCGGRQSPGAPATRSPPPPVPRRVTMPRRSSSWISAFNAELASKVGADDRVVQVDFSAFNDQVAMPAQFGLSNVKTPACPIVGVGSDGIFADMTSPAAPAQRSRQRPRPAPAAVPTGGRAMPSLTASTHALRPPAHAAADCQALAVRGWL